MHRRDRWKDVLDARRAQQFVGRRAELEIFEGILCGRAAGHFVYVQGPPGIGKSQLLHAFRRMAEARGQIVAWLEASCLAPDVFQVEQALDPVVRSLEGRGRRGGWLMIDGWERLAGLEAWFREQAFPRLDGETRVVAAGRQRLDESWRVDPGWCSELTVLELSPFTARETGDYLERRGLSQALAEPIFEESRGLPLSVGVLAETALQSPDAKLRLEDHPRALARLLERFLEDAPSARHALALRASALVLHTTPPLLAAMVGGEDANDLYRWLVQLTFTQHTERGVRPHDAVGLLLEAGLRIHGPVLWRRFLANALRYFVDELSRAPYLAIELLAETAYLASHVDAWLMNRADLGSWAIAAARPTDWDAIASMIERHEGTASVALARFWWERSGEWMIASKEGEPCGGFLHMLDLAEASPADIARDPGAAAARQHVLRSSGVASGRQAWLVRFWMDASTYQSVGPVQTAIALHVSGRLLSARADLTHILWCVRDRQFWASVTNDFTPQLIDATFESGGIEYGLLARDFSKVDTITLFRGLLAEHVARLEAQAPSSSAEAPGGSLPLVSAVSSPAELEEWVGHVKSALKVVDQPDLLCKSPLVDLTLVRHRAAGGSRRARAQVLAQLLHEEASRFRESARDAHYTDVLERAYFRPAAKLVVVADELGMGYSTLRRHLARSVRRLAANLRARELEMVTAAGSATGATSAA